MNPADEVRINVLRAARLADLGAAPGGSAHWAKSWATLAEFGASMVQHRAHYGVGGLHQKLWLTRAFRGFLYRLGRLEFEMQPFPFDDPSSAVAPGEWSLSIHIPPAGPLTPDSCDSALRCAGEFFRNHFPEHEWTHAHCTSWLLDPTLAECLPSTSNIVRFQKRFSLLDELTTDDAAVLQFVFDIPRDGSTPLHLDRLPQKTLLQRAIVSRLHSGGHWRVATGWIELA
jgi:hypothetical protein